MVVMSPLRDIQSAGREGGRSSSSPRTVEHFIRYPGTPTTLVEDVGMRHSTVRGVLVAVRIQRKGNTRRKETFLLVRCGQVRSGVVNR